MDISYFRGFLGNGSWLVVAHTKKCKRTRRGVCRGERVRSLVPNMSEAFNLASIERKHKVA